MKPITRRTVLRGGAAVGAVGVAVGGAVAVAAAEPLMASETDAATFAAVGRWHDAWEAYTAVMLWDETESSTFDQDEFYRRGYGEVVRAWSEAERKLRAVEPRTLPGVMALLSCAERITRDRETCRAGRNGKLISTVVFGVHPEPIWHRAYTVIERLTGRAGHA